MKKTMLSVLALSAVVLLAGCNNTPVEEETVVENNPEELEIIVDENEPTIDVVPLEEDEISAEDLEIIDEEVPAEEVYEEASVEENYEEVADGTVVDLEPVEEVAE